MLYNWNLITPTDGQNASIKGDLKKTISDGSIIKLDKVILNSNDYIIDKFGDDYIIIKKTHGDNRTENHIFNKIKIHKSLAKDQEKFKEFKELMNVWPAAVENEGKLVNEAELHGKAGEMMPIGTMILLPDGSKGVVEGFKKSSLGANKHLISINGFPSYKKLKGKDDWKVIHSGGRANRKSKSTRRRRRKATISRKLNKRNRSSKRRKNSTKRRKSNKRNRSSKR